MKTKLITLVKRHYIWILILGVYIALKIENNTLKNAVLESKTDQQEVLQTDIKERDKKNDSLKLEVKQLKNDVVLLKKSNDSLKELRTQNRKYYAKKINDVDNATNSELQRYLSEYKYTD